MLDYPFPPSVVLPLAAAALTGKQREFRRDALDCFRRLAPPLQVTGLEHLPTGGPCLITPNHYHRAGFFSPWIVLPISAVFPVEIHWIITSAWTSAGPLEGRPVEAVSKWVFRRLAQVYGWTKMPPMPPRPGEEGARAAAVRQVLGYAKKTQNPVIGLSPEGRDAENGGLHDPPPGLGRFVQRLSHLGLPILPIGLWEQEGRLCLRFGPLYCLPTVTGKTAEARDLEVSSLVMRKIAELLPEELR
jgi:hypothetical protein